MDKHPIMPNCNICKKYVVIFIGSNTLSPPYQAHGVKELCDDCMDELSTHREASLDRALKRVAVSVHEKILEMKKENQ